MEIYSQIVSKIIKSQEMIIGPIAIEQAMKVKGLEIIGENDVKISGNVKNVLDDLISQYSRLFGKASIEVCKEAVHGLLTKLPKEEVPTILN